MRCLRWAQEEDAEEDEEEEEEEEDLYDLPISHEVVLGSAHAKAVTCMDIEHTGSRLITGSMDYTIRIYDFHGMKRDMKAFRCGAGCLRSQIPQMSVSQMSVDRRAGGLSAGREGARACSCCFLGRRRLCEG